MLIPAHPAAPNGQGSPYRAPHTAALANEPRCWVACWQQYRACRHMAQDIGCLLLPCLARIWTLTWLDATATHRVTGRAVLALCWGSCAQPAHKLLTLPCRSQPDREMCSARSTCSNSSTAQPGWQPGPSARGHSWLPSRPATTHVPPAPGAGQGSGGIPLPVGDMTPGELGRGSQASCPARHCPMALPGTAVPRAPQPSHFFRDLNIAMPCPGWGQHDVPACAGRGPWQGASAGCKGS